MLPPGQVAVRFGGSILFDCLHSSVVDTPMLARRGVFCYHPPAMGALLRAVSTIDNIETHTFFPDSLGPQSVVVDFGANQGEFSRKIAQRYGLRTFGVEANPELFEKLKRMETDPANEGRVKFFHYAISDKDEPVELHLSSESTTSSITTSAVPGARGGTMVEGRTLGTFVREIGIDQIDLLKCDIEGAEVGMFRTASDDLLRRIGQITIEFHDHHGFHSVVDFQEMRDRLYGLGFAGIKFSPNNTNWLFYQSTMAGPARRAYVRYIVRNARGVFRRMGLRND
jgi:FkbM family methyltransferase